MSNIEKCYICGTEFDIDDDICPICGWYYLGFESKLDKNEREDFNLTTIAKAKENIKNGLDRWGEPIPKDRLAEGKYIDHEVYKDILLMAVEDIKGHADSYDENDMYIRTGLYMALAIIKTRAQIGYDTYMEDENLENIFLERLGLDEEFEFKFFEEHKKGLKNGK